MSRVRYCAPVGGGESIGSNGWLRRPSAARDLQLVVNLRTARALAIKVPQSIPVRADGIIE